MQSKTSGALRGTRKSVLSRAGTRIVSLCLGAALLLGVAGCGDRSDDQSLLRGDRAFARGEFNEALAEYRMALQRGDRSAEILARTGHVYATLGRIPDAREHYREAARLDPAMADLGAADFMAVARKAAAERDGIRAASAVDAASELRPGVSIEGLALPLARYYEREGRYEEALNFYLKAVREGDNSQPVIYDLARAYYEVGDCASAMVHFTTVRTRLPAAQRTDADLRTGECAITLAREASSAGDTDEALRLYGEMLTLGEPSSRIGDIWAEVGEIHVSRGECREAVDAFQAAYDRLPPARRSQVDRRLNDLRFGRRGGSGC